MKVLQVNAVYNIASTGRTTRELHDALLEMNIDSYVAYSISNIIPDDKMYLIGNKFDRKTHAFMSRVTGKQAYFSRKETQKLLKFMDKIKPDIVHLRNMHSNYINVPMILEYLAKNDISTVITLHDFWFMTGKCVHFSKVNCMKWKTLCNNCPNLKSGNQSWFFDRTKEVYTDKLNSLKKIKSLAVVGVSDWATEAAKESPFFSDAKAIERIYNWIDTDSFCQKDVTYLKEKLNIKEDFVVLGVASIWDERKDLKSFIKLAEKLPENSKVIIVGAINKDIKLPSNMIAVGTTHSVEEMSSYYNLADVFVTFSTEETFGKVSVEALSCGTPVVCYDATANKEVVGEGCGYVVEKGDFDAVLTCVNKIREKGKASYSSNCINFVHSQFDKKERIDEYISLYKKLIELKK